MAIVLLVIATLALAVRVLATGGSAALYGTLAPRTAASLEAGAVAAAVLAAGAGGLALFVSTGGTAVVLFPVLALAPAVVLAVDLLPRSLAQGRVQILPTSIRTVAHRLLAMLGAPLRALETASARVVSGAGDGAPPIGGQVLAGLLRRDRGAEEPALSSPQVIRRIFEFRQRTVHELMVPLIHIYAVRDDAPIEEAVTLVRREKVSRIPVFHERMYNIVGIVHSFDLLAVTEMSGPVARIMRLPLYVPGTKPANEQLRLMQRHGLNMAVVVDEHGGTIGVVTVEDLLEEIVGEIEDEYDQGEVLYETLPDGLVRVQGAMKVDRLNELFPWRLPSGDYETIAGLVITQLGRIPPRGARLRLPIVTLEVSRADERAVREVIVRPTTAE